MKPTKKRIEAEIRKLRRLIDASPGDRVARAAYLMEHALRWAIEDTVGWDLCDMARQEKNRVSDP